MFTEKQRNRNADNRRLYTLSLTALGIVFGDIGTSPLYAMRACFNGLYGIEANPENILGVLSTIIWSLIIVVSAKYVAVVMNADNKGEGGILSLMALLVSHRRTGSRVVLPVVGLGIFGAALLFGDGMITPAISVLSAVEGLEVITPVFTPYTIPLTLAILFVLFAVQRRGTARIGAAFGPIMLVWFVLLSLLGLFRIIESPGELIAFNPYYAARFFMLNRLWGFFVLGAVFLVVTGAEMMYADIGHFGKSPIRLAWFVLVFPALVLNYLGQGALLIRTPTATANPFYHLVPSWRLVPLVVIATVATVIASQAVISGVFSLTHQAVQLDYSPRMKIQHSSPLEIGQVYVPWMNWILFIAASLLVLFFRSSANLAAAYGVAVSTTMAITTILTLFLQDLIRNPSIRVPGTAVYLGGLKDLIPQPLLHNIKHNKIVHSWVLLM
ncbi:MAG: KUP/HAK/KT family potassium transporter [Spirochaetaceae bacterium]|nr:MAG: KUP/HAK/KT family potassium transporter [Spirochaetaceae bacterium]